MELKVIIRGLWDRLGGWLLIALGGLALLLGWVGVSGTAFTSEQLPYVVSGGLFGLALIGTGATLLISGDLRDEWRKLDDIEAAILQLRGEHPAIGRSGAGVHSAGAAEDSDPRRTMSEPFYINPTVLAPPTPRLPWRSTDKIILGVFTLIGFVTLFVAWWGVSGTAKVSDAVPWLNAGAAGVMVLGTGNFLWLLTARRAVGERRRVLLHSFEKLAEAPVAPMAVDAVAGNGSGPLLLAAPGMRHYHRADCQLVIGKSTTSATAADHQREGRRPCGMCEP